MIVPGRSLLMGVSSVVGMMVPACTSNGLLGDDDGLVEIGAVLTPSRARKSVLCCCMLGSPVPAPPIGTDAGESVFVAVLGPGRAGRRAAAALPPRRSWAGPSRSTRIDDPKAFWRSSRIVSRTEERPNEPLARRRPAAAWSCGRSAPCRGGPSFGGCGWRSALLPGAFWTASAIGMVLD